MECITQKLKNKGDSKMIGIVIGLVIFLTILAACIKFGNEEKQVQRRLQDYWTIKVIEEMEKCKAGK